MVRAQYGESLSHLGGLKWYRTKKYLVALVEVSYTSELPSLPFKLRHRLHQVSAQTVDLTNSCRIDIITILKLVVLRASFAYWFTEYRLYCKRILNFSIVKQAHYKTGIIPHTLIHVTLSTLLKTVDSFSRALTRNLA